MRNLLSYKSGNAYPVSTIHVGFGLPPQLGKNRYRRIAGEVGLRLEW